MFESLPKIVKNRMLIVTVAVVLIAGWGYRAQEYAFALAIVIGGIIAILYSLYRFRI